MKLEIDSVIYATNLNWQIRLIPRIDHLPWFTGAPANVAKKEEYYRRCADYIDADEEIIPEECKHHFNTISVFVFNGALCK